MVNGFQRYNFFRGKVDCELLLWLAFTRDTMSGSERENDRKRERKRERERERLRESKRELWTCGTVVYGALYAHCTCESAKL